MYPALFGGFHIGDNALPGLTVRLAPGPPLALGTTLCVDGPLPANGDQAYEHRGTTLLHFMSGSRACLYALSCGLIIFYVSSLLHTRFLCRDMLDPLSGGTIRSLNVTQRCRLSESPVALSRPAQEKRRRVLDPLQMSSVPRRSLTLAVLNVYFDEVVLLEGYLHEILDSPFHSSDDPQSYHNLLKTSYVGLKSDASQRPSFEVTPPSMSMRDVS